MRRFVLPFLLLLAGLWLCTYAATRLYRSHASLSWPTVGGRVVSSEVENFRVRRGTTYAPKVSYAYSVAGKPYLSDVVAFSAPPSGAVEARQVVKQFPSGSEVTVHYAPGSPDESCLVAGEWNWRDLMPLLLGLVLTGAGAASSFEAWKNPRAGKQRSPKAKG